MLRRACGAVFPAPRIQGVIGEKTLAVFLLVASVVAITAMMSGAALAGGDTNPNSNLPDWAKQQLAPRQQDVEHPRIPMEDSQQMAMNVAVLSGVLVIPIGVWILLRRQRRRTRDS